MSTVVIGNEGTLANYPQGGGHWSLFLQYLLGLQALGHDVRLLEIAWAPRGDVRGEAQLVDDFFGRLSPYGLVDAASLLVFDDDLDSTRLELTSARIQGGNAASVRALAAGADVLWNFAGSLRGELLHLFPHRVFLDVDPGVIQVSGLQWDLGLQDHHAFLTAGANVGRAGCPVPELDLEWQTFFPFVHLPAWPLLPPPPSTSAFTSITHWNWDVLAFDGGTVSMSKRDAYLAYADLPRLADARCELATNGLDDADARRMRDGGWTLVDAWEVTDTPAAYRGYIGASRAEICCPKPVYTALRSGWISDRSVGYLASGRPVAMEDTGLADHVPTTSGLVTFAGLDDAVDAVRGVADDYARHRADARRIAEEHFSAATVLPQMLDAST